VVPSLPGYAFSEPPRTPGWDVARVASGFVELMGRLGYERYGAQGGDWGAQVTTRVRLNGSQRVRAVAQLSDGSWWSGDAEVEVTESACLDAS